MTVYPEMNNKIVDLLRMGDTPVELYAAQRIEELELKNKELIDRVLEIVAKNRRISFQVLYTGTPNPAAFAAIEAIENYVDRLREDILEMKDGEQE